MNIPYSGEDLADKRNVHFPNCFTIHVVTLDEGTVLQALYNGINWVVVTNKCLNTVLNCHLLPVVPSLLDFGPQSST